MFHYCIWEDEAQDTSNELEQKDHCQTDAELWGKERNGHKNVNIFWFWFSLGDRFHKISLCANVAVAYLSYLCRKARNLRATGQGLTLNEILEKANKDSFISTLWGRMIPHVPQCTLFSIYFCTCTRLQTKGPQNWPLCDMLKASGWKTPDLLSAGGRYFHAGSPRNHKRWWWRWKSPQSSAL